MINTLTDGCVGSNCKNALETYIYNNRLQPSMIQLGNTGSGQAAANSSLTYNYVFNGGNNGNVMGYTYQEGANGYSNLSHTMAYTYDGVNRLLTATATGGQTLNQSFKYDAFGNMNCAAGSTPQYTCDAANHLTNDGAQTLTYDAAGNMATAGAYTYRHDGEGRLWWMYHTSDVYPQGEYWYNALGQRMVRYNGSVGQWEVIYNDPWGNEALVENLISGVAQEIYLPPVAGRHYAMYYGGVTYFTHANALGSSGILTDQTGTAKQETLFMPWGGEWAQAGYGGYPINLQYAGMRPMGPAAPEGSYFFTPNRAFMPNWGRWLTPDPAGTKAVTLTDPQTWNMYAYARNNPTTLTDPSGLIVQCSSSLGKKDAATCQGIIDAANLRDKKGNYVYKNLHDVYKRLNDDKRTFSIVNNNKLGSNVAGRFDVRLINSSRTDFSAGTINLDFSKIKSMTGPSSSMIAGFQKYQGLTGKFGLEMAEAFGHEGEHGVYSLNHLLGAVNTQSLINDELENLQMHDMGAVRQDAAAAQPFLDATELDAQQTEQKINQELNPNQ